MAAGGTGTQSALDGAPRPETPPIASAPQRRRAGASGLPRDFQPFSPGAAADASSSKGADGGGAAPAPVSDNGFQVGSGGYLAKLVWLPDYSKPMAITETPGLFGSASMSVTLANGWMLTSLNGSGDSKTAETLTALASLASSIGGVVTGVGAVKPKAGGVPGADETPRGAASLRPGLYEFRYDEVTGRIVGVCAVSFFTASGPVSAGRTGCEPPALPRPTSAIGE